MKSISLSVLLNKNSRICPPKGLNHTFKYTTSCIFPAPSPSIWILFIRLPDTDSTSSITFPSQIGRRGRTMKGPWQSRLYILKTMLKNPVAFPYSECTRENWTGYTFIAGAERELLNQLTKNGASILGNFKHLTYINSFSPHSEETVAQVKSKATFRTTAIGYSSK